MPAQAKGKQESADATKDSECDGGKEKSSRAGKRKRENSRDARCQEALSTEADEPVRSTSGKKRKKTEVNMKFSRGGPVQEETTSQDRRKEKKKRWMNRGNT